MRRKQLSLTQKVFVVKHFYQRNDMREVRKEFDKAFKIETTESSLEVFLKLISEFERTGQVTQSVFYEGKAPTNPLSDTEVKQEPKKRGRKPKVKLEEQQNTIITYVVTDDLLPAASDLPEAVAGPPAEVVDTVKVGDQEWTYKIEWPAEEGEEYEEQTTTEQEAEEKPFDEDYTETEYIPDDDGNEDAAPTEEEEEEQDDNEMLAPRKRKRARKQQSQNRVDCCVCEKTYTPEFINSHMRKHDREGHVYDCADCEKTFAVYEAYRIHSETHIPVHKYRFQCATCQEKFVSQDRLNLHQKDHAQPKSYCCEWCGMVFAKSDSLKVHTRTHTGEKPLKCGECDECFAFYGSLKSHMKKHTGGEYKCNFCDKMFVYKVDRNLHHREHTGAKPYVCHICNRGCVAPHNLRSHLKILHKIEISLEEIQAQNYVGALDPSLATGQLQ